MLNVLINAYAVAPNWGSEQGMGWNWISGLAEYHNLFVITEGEWKKEIEKAVEIHPFKNRLHFYYIPVSSRVRRMCWNQGDWRFYLYYRKWQKKALALAREICINEHIDITHQLNMCGFREPGDLWRINGVKHVWGPIGNMGHTPVDFLRDMPLTARLKVIIKNTITSYQIRHGIVKKAINHCDCLVAALNITHDKILSCYGKDVEVISETGLVPNEGCTHSECEGVIDLMWVGRFIPTKKLSIALQALSKVENTAHFHLHIVGSGSDKENEDYKKMAEDLGVGNSCTFYGKLPNDLVQQMMRKNDLLFFTSVFEGGPHVVLEAIANNLPIICFDTCGQGSVVDDSIGMKIPLKSYNEGVDGFAKLLDYFDHNRDVIPILSSNCTAKQNGLTWESKIKRMADIYEETMRM